ncbi:GAF domain-containing protein [Actinomadura madurae]|nr:GAF domain-containing protein [Actinomadura madurae]MCQ0003605.1 GAF domain-containing protein [Actinomadura madurae]
MSEFDAGSKELRVRTTLGSISPSLPGLRVPPGIGLASQVVEGRRPCWTSKYATMTQVPHDSGIDAAVKAEGLVSLLGVPLLADDQVLGVLFAANRFEHAFSPEEISLLSAFADHAAIVLQTARLLARARDSADEARRAYGELARHVEAVERASEVHNDLTNLILQGGDAPDVATALGRALRCHVRLLETDDTDEPLREAVDRSRQSGRCVPVGGGAFVVAIVAGTTSLGALLLEQGEVAFGPVELRTAERAAQITALLNLKQEAMIEAEKRVRGDLLADLLSNSPGRRADIATRARAQGIRLGDLRSVVVVCVPSELRRDAVLALRQIGGLVGAHAEHVVALTSDPDPRTASTHVHQAVSRTLQVPVLAAGANVTDAAGRPAHAGGRGLGVPPDPAVARTGRRRRHHRRIPSLHGPLRPRGSAGERLPTARHRARTGLGRRTLGQAAAHAGRLPQQPDEHGRRRACSPPAQEHGAATHGTSDPAPRRGLAGAGPSLPDHRRGPPRPPDRSPIEISSSMDDRSVPHRSHANYRRSLYCNHT